MTFLILGQGGRESALAWKLHQSELCTQLFTAPGNPGTTRYGTNVPLSVMDFDGLKDFCIQNDVDYVIVGPEAPLVDGIEDYFKNDPAVKTIVIGPSAAAAQLEGSKAFAKKFMKKYGIPTAGYLEVTQDNIGDGLAFLASLPGPYVLKADGLAAGKGVLILDNLEEAKKELQSMLEGKFGDASSTVVIEEFLSGTEFSVFALTNGKEYVLLPSAKDYKRIGEGDTGPNTGGMGAISPVPFLTEELERKVIKDIVIPTIDGIRSEKMNYLGFVFFGLINVQGQPFVIEYNCRLGDPETEVILPRYEGDLGQLLQAAAQNTLSQMTVRHSPDAAATIIMVSGGYPGDYSKGYPIHGLVDSTEKSIIFHAGTEEKNGDILTSGGRVLAVTSWDTDFREAVKTSLQLAGSIYFEGKYFRKDIGFDL